MNLVQITPGAGGMYCGNCFRDNALVAALRRDGHDTLMVPLYLPMTLDEASTVRGTPTFFGGINVFLSQKVPGHSSAPAWLRRWLDHPALLQWASGRAAKTRASDVGELNLSMLQGEEGRQRRELDDLVRWLASRPRPDAILLSNALLVGFARRLRRDVGCPVFVFLQSEEAFLEAMPEPWRGRGWATLSERGREVDGWIAPSRWFGERMLSRLGIDVSRLRVVPNGISMDGYRSLAERPLWSPGQPWTLGFFARQCPEKGLDIVVDAFIELRRDPGLAHVRLKVGGGCGPSDEPFVAMQREKLARAGLLQDASFHPNVSRADKLAFLASCDVLSVPGRQPEAFGLYQIEAMAAGTPVLQPSEGPYPEIIGSTGGGALFGENSSMALAGALRDLLRHPARLRELGAAGRAAVQQRHTDTAMAQGTVEAIRSLVGMGRSGW